MSGTETHRAAFTSCLKSRPDALLIGIVAILVSSGAASAEASEPSDRWAAIGFGGVPTSNNWQDFFLDPGEIDFQPANFAGAGVSYRLGTYFGGLDVEIEVQAVKYFGDQTNWEFNLPVVARWTKFPWGETIDTSVAFGLGPSWAASTPELEELNEDGTEQLLAYWTLEIEAGPPESIYSGFIRLHHRSVAFGTFGDSGGVNALALGLRRSF